ncbi:MAG: FAD/NAD(P)-binding oxidoreductase [Clostridiales bacterium GWF2_36_10]|nr:MAG: FAD/NAD(P)-binding oxidoreductase [Clostridiales bacterium GWF2_36_10]HAN21420.1 FAD/NAD(P)-binding oxidoreductase [Clostridiales bacterium]
MYDVAIIGAGICGASVSFLLSQKKLKICVIEKETDVSMGTTKANSAIIHAGYDPEPDTLMARLNVRGTALIKELAPRLSVPYKQIGSLVLAFNEQDLKTINKLYERGKINGVPDMQILKAEETFAKEPNIDKHIKGSLWAPSAAVVSPWELCTAMCEVAAENGCEFFLENEVTAIENINDYFKITTSRQKIQANYIINAAGIHSDIICKMAGECDFSILPSKGQYYLLDKNQGELIHHILFQCPTKAGKGILVSPTTSGNLIVGPNAEIDNKSDDLATTREGLDFVANTAKHTTDKINYRDNVRNFSGLRAISTRDDFIIEPASFSPRFINVAGIKSPGLSAAPAIAEYVLELLEKSGLELEQKENYSDSRKRIVFNELSDEEKKKCIKENPAYGNIVCRCNTITEGEILQALHSPLPPRTLDGVKRRAGTGMGRCQGGFCSPRVHEIISRELGIPFEQVEQDKKGSYIVLGEF